MASDVEKLARELLARAYSEGGFPRAGDALLSGRSDTLDECALAAIAAALTQPAASGEVVRQFQGRDGLWYGFHDKKHEDNTIASGDWPIRTLYATPQPDADTVRDAERYRWLREQRGKNNRWPHIAQTARQDFDTEEVPQLFDRRFGDKFAERLDAAIDSAIKGEKS